MLSPSMTKDDGRIMTRYPHRLHLLVGQNSFFISQVGGVRRVARHNSSSLVNTR